MYFYKIKCNKMGELQIIHKLEKDFNFKFNEASNPRNIFFDLAEKEGTYSLNPNKKIIGLKIKGFDLPEIPAEITSLESLNVLNLSGNSISDLSPLSGLKKITALNLVDNDIIDLKPLEYLTNLKWVNLQFNAIIDITPIFKLKQIRKLYLDSNAIINIQGISRLNLLKELSLVSNKIKDIKPLTFNGNLTKLDLSSNRISNIGDILKLTKLEELNISRNRIVKVPDFKELKLLSSLNISHNKITNTKVFEGLRCSINASGNAIKDVYVFNEPQNGVLNIDWLADISSNIIDQIVSEKGSMLGIFGKWGRGKTFFWNRLSEKMKQKNYEVVEFLAWKYHDTPASWAYLYEAFAKVFYRKPNKNLTLAWIPYLFKILFTNFRREPILNILRFLVSIIVPIFLYFAVKENIANFSGNWEFIGGIEFKIGFWGTYAAVVSYYFSKIYSLNVPNIFKRISAKSFENLLGMQAAIEKEFVFLTKIWKKRIILFVDDLDRCSEDRILTVIDSLRIMTENSLISKQLTVIAAIDERILKRVIKNKYKEMVEEDETVLNNLTREYLDKLFLFGIKLSALNNNEKIEIFDNYTSNLQVLFGSLNVYEKHTYTEGQIVYPEDFTFIRMYLKKVKEITPRQIRIIYNKFILANEILKLKTEQEELTLEQKEVTIALIMWFSFEKKIEELNIFFNDTKEIGLEEITKTIFDKKFTATGEMWQKYVNAVRTTVPY